MSDAIAHIKFGLHWQIFTIGLSVIGLSFVPLLLVSYTHALGVPMPLSWKLTAIFKINWAISSTNLLFPGTFLIYICSQVYQNARNS